MSGSLSLSSSIQLHSVKLKLRSARSSIWKIAAREKTIKIPAQWRRRARAVTIRPVHLLHNLTVDVCHSSSALLTSHTSLSLSRWRCILRSNKETTRWQGMGKFARQPPMPISLRGCRAIVYANCYPFRPRVCGRVYVLYILLFWRDFVC